MSDSPYIFEATSETFHQLVLEQSHQVPVLVDFWADWCQPCQMLMPILSKLADEMQGAFVLVKVNSDANQELAMQFAVRGLPTVKVFKNGEAVDEFTGVQPEPVIRELINKYRTRASDVLRQQALQTIQTDPEQAAQMMLQVIEAEPDYYDAVLDFVGIKITLGQTDGLDFTLDSLPEDQVDKARLDELKSLLKLAHLRGEAGNLDELRQQLQASPEDLSIMLQLAKAYAANNLFEESLELYLSIMSKDRQFNDDAGRLGMLETFELLGKGDPLVKKYRNKMFSLMH